MFACVCKCIKLMPHVLHMVVQFERTLIVADEDSQVSYLEGCTAPSYDKNQVCFTTSHCKFLLLCTWIANGRGGHRSS